MSLMPISSIMHGLSSLTSMFRTNNSAELLGDQEVSLDEFQDLLAQIMTNITGEDAENNPEADKMAESLSPTLFSMIDKDANGLIEGDEAESLQAFLQFFNPDLIQAAFDRSLGGHPAQMEGEPPVMEGAPPEVLSPTVQRLTGRPNPALDRIDSPVNPAQLFLRAMGR